ncbi:MAG: hypothetical protein LBT14_04260 [Treponema sp.]|jgi:hypothetical protein|nr:hypothetical protein [Treponema sp.]
MKKLAAVCIIGLVLGIAGVFAEDQQSDKEKFFFTKNHPDGWGIGVQVGGGNSGGGAALSLKIPALPIFWAVNLGFNSYYFGLGVSGDYYFIDKELVPAIKLGWYWGVGGYVGLGFWDDDHGPGYGNDDGGMSLALGVRSPIGLTWQPLKFLEVFLQAVPSIGLGIVPGVGLDWGIGGNLGIRFWF